MSKLKIIGTGLSGLVGSRIVELLKDDFNFVDFSIDTGIDILNIDQLKSAFDTHQDADVVLHLAAFTDTNAAWIQRGDNSGLCYRLNVDGTQNLLDLCNKYHKYLICISTDFVFDGQKEGSYTEDDTPNPIEWYGETKYLGEKLILSSGLPAAVARIAFPYRARFEPKKDIIRKTIDGFKTYKLYPQWTDHFTTLTFIDDIASGLKIFFDQKPTGIYHLVGSSSQSPFDMCQIIAETFGFDKNLIKPSTLVDYLASQPPGSRPWQKNLSLSNAKVSALGIKMKSLSEGLHALKQQL